MNNAENLQAEAKYLDAISYAEKNNDYSEALKKLMSVTEAYPNFPNAYSYLGWIYVNFLNDNKRAEEFYKKAIACSSDFLPAYYNLSSLYLNASRYDDAEKLHKKMLKIPGVFVGRVYFDQALLCEYTEKYNEAVKLYKMSIKETSDDERIRLCNAAIARCQNKKHSAPYNYYFAPEAPTLRFVLTAFMVIFLISILAAVFGK